MSDTDLWNIDLLDTHLDLLDTDITSKNFVCLRDVLKTSSRYVFKTSSRHVFKTSSRHVFKTSSRYVFKTSSRRLQRNNFSSSKTSSRRLERRKIVTLKTCWRPANFYWDKDRSSRPKLCCKNVVFKKFTKFTIKQICRNLALKKSARRWLIY